MKIISQAEVDDSQTIWKRRGKIGSSDLHARLAITPRSWAHASSLSLSSDSDLSLNVCGGVASKYIEFIYYSPSCLSLSLLLERLMEAAAAAEQLLPHRCH